MILPQHVGVIVDGNRRWAKAKGLPTLEGHRAGYAHVKELARWIFKRGIPWASFYLFSRENWQRAKEEVNYLFDLLELGLSDDIQDFINDGVRLYFVGNRKQLRPRLQELMAKAEQATVSGSKGNLVACINYGGQQEIVEGIQQLAKDGVDLSQLTVEQLKSSLSTRDVPPLDLMIRTSGEQRVSNFLLWEIVYSELYFSPHLFPDFSEDNLDKTLEWYGSRQRRFGA